jgi:hypothetical protein
MHSGAIQPCLHAAHLFVACLSLALMVEKLDRFWHFYNFFSFFLTYLLFDDVVESNFGLYLGYF